MAVSDRPRRTRAEVVDRLTDLFRDAGYEGVSISVISAATGLGRSSLYHYFPGGKPDMALAVMQSVAGWLEDTIVAALLRPEPRGERIDAMISFLEDRHEGGRKPSILASMAVGRGTGEGPLETLVRATMVRWIDALTRALAETGLGETEARRRAVDAIARIEGGLVLSRVLGMTAPYSEALAHARGCLLAP